MSGDSTPCTGPRRLMSLPKLALMAACGLAGVGDCRGALADVIQINSAAGLSASDTSLPLTDATGTVLASSRVAFSAGGQTLTFSNTSGNGFEVDQADVNYADTSYAAGTKILFSGGFQGPGGPLTIAFSQPVTEFGFNAEEFTNPSYNVSFTAYDGQTLLGTFTSAGCDSCGTGPSQLSFEGLDAIGGSLITSVVLIDDSTDNLGLGNIRFGDAPTSVPEPATLTLLAGSVVGIFTIRRRHPRKAT